MTPRPPYVGDVLLEPQRFVCWVDRDARAFRCQPLIGTPRENAGDDLLPARMRDAPWEAAPIEEGWTELPILTLP